VWGPARLDDTRRLRSYIKLLRQKIEVDPAQPRLLLTEAGVGYRLKGDAG
jgi:two-component system KDP operon response regulator KdpE